MYIQLFQSHGAYGGSNEKFRIFFVANEGFGFPSKVTTPIKWPKKRANWGYNPTNIELSHLQLDPRPTYCTRFLLPTKPASPKNPSCQMQEYLSISCRT